MTTFPCRFGNFKFEVIPFGLMNGPFNFSWIMEQSEGGISLARICLHDFAVFWLSIKKHLEHLRAFLSNIAVLVKVKDQKVWFRKDARQTSWILRRKKFSMSLRRRLRMSMTHRYRQIQERYEFFLSRQDAIGTSSRDFWRYQHLCMPLRWKHGTSLDRRNVRGAVDSQKETFFTTHYRVYGPQSALPRQCQWFQRLHSSHKFGEGL